MTKRNKKQCKKCNRFISLSNYQRHIKSCNGVVKDRKLYQNIIKQSDNKYQCPFCNKVYNKKGIYTHIWRVHGQGKNHNPNIYDNRYAWNKGLTKKTDNRILKHSLNLKEKYLSGEITPSFLGKHHKSSTKKIMSQKLSLNNKGGRCKWFIYKKDNGQQFKVQGTWQFRFSKCLQCIDQNFIKIGVGDKKHSLMWIDDNNKEHTYSPDFYSPLLNKYFQVKGFWWGNDKRKMQIVMNKYKDINIQIVQQYQLKLYQQKYIL